MVVAVDAAESDCFVEDASIAAAFMQLQATELGLGACWIQVRNRFTAVGTLATRTSSVDPSTPTNCCGRKYTLSVGSL